MLKLRNIVVGLSTCIIPMFVSARPMEAYIPDWAVSYARQWVSDTQTLRNPNYVYFNKDCTNFVSQSLRAGGWRNTAIGPATSDLYWYHVPSSQQSSQTWKVANALHRRFSQGYEGWTGGKILPYMTSQINYGDIVFADWNSDGYIDHSMIVTGFRRKSDGTLEPRLSYHSTDRKDITWTDFIVNAANPVPMPNYQLSVYSKYPYRVTPLASQIF